MIGDGDVDLEHVGDRSQQTLGLSQRLMEDQADRKARLDGDRRIDRLAAPLSGSRCLPDRDRLLGQPHCQAPAPDQRGVVVRPVRDPILGPGDLVATALVELVRHGSHQSGACRPYRHSANLTNFAGYNPRQQRHNLRSIHAPTPMITAARIVAHTGGIERFQNRDAYVRYTGIAPLARSSGRTAFFVKANRGTVNLIGRHFA